MERNMNTGVYEALRQAGTAEEQAIVIATAIPDIAQPIRDLRTEMDHRFEMLQAEMDRRFEQVNTQMARQRTASILSTLAIIASTVTTGAAALAITQGWIQLP